MKTLLIFNEFSEGSRILVFDEDLSRFEDVFINAYTDDPIVEQKQEELLSFMYGSPYQKFLHKDKVVKTPFRFEGTAIIVHCGFIP